MLKRTFDIVLSLTGLILALPFFVGIAILIKLDSKGPVFFRQIRIGKDGTSFYMLKFRTMMEVEHWSGAPLSPKNDPRVTGFGAILRRMKINEFPQLINVLKGDMSFVGPRPEVPEFVKLYNKEEKKILSVRPGIVGPSQIHMRNEEELYAEGADPKEYYISHILPKKLEIDLGYVDSQSFVKDVFCLVQGIGITITGAITKRHLFENAEQITLFLCDAVICGFSYFLAYLLRMEGELAPIHKTIVLSTLPLVVVARMLAFTFLGLYVSLIQYFSSYELIRIVKAVTLSSTLIVLLIFLIGERTHPRSVFAIDWFILICLLPGYRLSLKTLRNRLRGDKKKAEKRILIYGVEDMGGLALRYVRMDGNKKVVAFIDDDPRKMRKRFRGIKILGSRHDIEPLVKLYRVDHVLIAKPEMNPEDLEQIKSLCEKANVECEVFALAN